jgi:hypothetical protein
MPVIHSASWTYSAGSVDRMIRILVPAFVAADNREVIDDIQAKQRSEAFET